MPSRTTTSGEQSALPIWVENGQIPLLNGLRAVAVIGVMLAHCCQTNGFPWSRTVAPLAVHGAIGVEIFFVLSGFLITTLLIRESNRTGRINIPQFYLRRTLRIVPAYVCLLAVVAVMQTAGVASVTTPEWVAAGTYTVNFFPRPAWEIGHAWSLSIEEHFYLVWPFVFALSGVLAARRLAILCIAIAFLGRWVVLICLPEYTTMAELCTFTRMDTIAFGCLLALGIHDRSLRRHLNQLGQIHGMPVVCIAAIVLTLCIGEFSTKVSVGLCMTTLGALLTLLMWSLLLRSERSGVQWLNHPWLMRIGVCSYSIYLWQQLFLNPRTSAPWTAFPLNVVFALAAAWLSYRFIERPCLKLKDRFSRSAASTAGADPGWQISPTFR